MHYGLADAPRHFYLGLPEELIKLGATQSKLHQGLFYWLEDGHLAAILVCHVDNILGGGTPRFKSAVIDNLSSVLKFRAEHSSAFTYIGIQLEQHSDFSIMLNQNNFAASIKMITLLATSDANTLLTDKESTALCSAIGQLNWLAGMSRPEINFEICNVASKVKEATICDAIQINKVITRVQSEETQVTFPPLDLNSVPVKAYADGSFNSLPDGGSLMEAKLSSYAISRTTQARYPGVPQGYVVSSALSWLQRPWQCVMAVNQPSMLLSWQDTFRHPERRTKH